MHRRQFLQAGAAASLALPAFAHADQPSPKDKIVAAVMGTGGRGTGLAKAFAQQPGVEVAYVCDVDKKRVENAAAEVTKVAKQGAAPKTVSDFRKILDDKAVDALVVATCNH